VKNTTGYIAIISFDNRFRVQFHQSLLIFRPFKIHPTRASDLRTTNEALAEFNDRKRVAVLLLSTFDVASAY